MKINPNLKKKIGILLLGIFIIIFGIGFRPFLKYPPWKDKKGYYILDPSKRRFYTEDAKKAYVEWRLANMIIIIGLGFIISVPIGILIEKLRR